ncbi:MAG: DNA adenine methylase [Vicinamibacteria bacterium]
MLLDHPAGTPPAVVAPRPFLKWAGGKRQLLPALRRHVPAHFGVYHEPFLGSAALFFDLVSRGRVASACLSDTNAELVGCFAALRRSADDVIAALGALADAHAAEGAAHFYEARARFNAATTAWRAAGGSPEQFDATLAALFVYLNRTGYNGLFRRNARGDFNVPAGRYRNPRICDAEGLRTAAAALARPGVALAHAPWQRVLDDAAPGDFVYFDPPYAPVSATARFTSYTAGGFDDDDQRALAEAARTLARRGCHVVLSNSTAPIVLALYEADRATRAAGLRVRRVPARRAINANAARRGAVLEVIVTNVPEVMGDP